MVAIVLLAVTELGKASDMEAITGDLSITLGEGVVLTARTDVALAALWAEHEHGPEAWAALTLGQRSVETAAALDSLRAAYGRG